MKRILAMVCLAALLTASFSVLRAENRSTSMRLYGEGKYQVGENFEAGEYVLTAAEQTGSFVVSVDAEGLDVISEDSFEANTILVVENGDYLNLIGCAAVYAEDYFTFFGSGLIPSGGMLKVGANLRPGDYELLGEDGKTPAYRIYQDARFRLVEEEGEFRESCRVRVAAGQYLELINCVVGALLSADNGDQAAINSAQAAEEMRKVRIDEGRTPALRSIPSTQGAKIGEAEAGEEYELLETEGKWYKIRLENGAEGWITSGMAEIVE